MFWLAVCLFFVGLAVVEGVCACIVSSRAGQLEDNIRMNDKGKE